MAANPDETLVRLRTRLLDLQKAGAFNPEFFGTYQQTILQVYNEAERKKQACLQQAESLKRQAAAVEAQAHAFGTFGSILFSVVNGYVELEQKRLREEHEAHLAAEGQLPAQSASGAAYEESEPKAPKGTAKKRRRKKKT